MKSETRSNLCIVTYESLQELCELPAPKKTGRQFQHNLNLWNGINDREKTAAWYGVEKERLVLAMREGWQEGAEQIRERMQGLSSIAAPVSIKRRRIRVDFGDSVDMQAVYRGNVEQAWTRCAKRETRAPRPVTLVASMQGTGDVEQSVFFARGAALLKTADLLTEAGYAVEVVADYTLNKTFNRDNGNKLVQRIPLKAAQEPLDAARLAACVALAGFKRHYGFLAAIRASNDIFDRQHSTSIGYSTDARKLNDSEIIGFEEAQDIPSAIKVVERTIKRIQEGEDQQQAA